MTAPRKARGRSTKKRTTAEIVPLPATSGDGGFAERLVGRADPLRPGEDEYTELCCALVAAARLLRRRALRLYDSMDAMGFGGTSIPENEEILTKAAAKESYADILLRQYVRMQRAIYPQRDDWKALSAEAQGQREAEES